MSVALPRRRRAEINVVPLVDVMVVLVFFLLLSSRLEDARMLGVVPPAAASGASGSASSAAVVAVDREGRMFLEGREVEPAALVSALAGLARARPGTEVVVVADERSQTGAAVRALDAAGRAGLSARLLTRPER